MSAALRTMVLGLGNLVMSDDGVGVRVVNHLADWYRFPDDVVLLDGGTLGLDILPRLEGIDRLLVVDAVDNGKSPGDLVRLVGDEVPVALSTKLSPHQMGLKDLLAVAELQGILPTEVVLAGVQPGSIEMGMELSVEVEGALSGLAGLVLSELERWGVAPAQ
ncbi:HyaD/HybD family hydrogenase maturation endopeptidase [Geobacter pelophilus]|jgi:hydrogenase maturation protease|uniref:HyaD/HybD family hydrogenase maturation endopeptidase n=1 Tax=Geoanaerobacter pelophilus TaxID=60036 RepID=A0AAW4KZJ2_9BACT|nr:HyaD/HybD family hydrogenase maturation endopeptidase [Geoanaerobacter pelophilus]MBT0664068.1 HyaD/HybD family hydrogenase maturation endopeptidase [Geoanaerobacter pelophilus]